MAGFPLTRLVNREQLAQWFKLPQSIVAFESAQKDILELFKRIFGDAPADGSIYGRRDNEWTQVPTGSAPVNLGYEAAADRGTVTNTAGADAEIPRFTAEDAGLVPAPVIADATKVLYDDGIWRVPAAGESLGYVEAFLVPWGTGFSYTLSPGALAFTGTTTNTAPSSITVWSLSLPKTNVTGFFDNKPWSIGQAGVCFVRGSANMGGFRVRFVVGTPSTYALAPFFAGVTSQPDNVPQSPLDFKDAVGFGGDTADGNWQIMHSNGTTAYTKISTSVARGADQAFEIIIEGDASGVYVTVNQIASNGTKTSVYAGLLTTNIPAAGQGLGFVFGGRTAAFSFDGNGVLYGIRARWRVDGAV